MAEPRRVAILGAAGRDFHNFNVLHRDDPTHHVVAFTATQIPGIFRARTAFLAWRASLLRAMTPDRLYGDCALRRSSFSCCPGVRSGLGAGGS